MADILVEDAQDWDRIKKDQVLPLGASSEDLVRHLANIVIVKQASSWRVDEFSKICKRIGVDVWKVVNEAIPEKGPEHEKTTKAKMGKKTT